VSEPGLTYRGERFQVPTRITTVTRQTGEYKVDLTCHPKFPFAFEEITIAFGPSSKKIMGH
jgi:hypothetical protein